MVNLKKRNSRFVVALTLVLCCAGAWAQPSTTLDMIKSKYKDDGSILLKRREEIFMKPGASKVDIRIDHTMQIMVMNEKSLGASGDRIPYDPTFLIIKDLEACTWIPNGKSYKKMPVKDIADVQSIDDESFVNSTRYKQFTYPGLSVGAVMEVNYVYDVLDMTSLGSFQFGYSVPCEELELVVNVPESVEIGTFQFGDFSHVTHTEEKKGSMTKHTWRATNVKPLKYANFMDNDDKLVPHLYVYVKSYTIKGEKKELFGTKENLYNYNYKFIKDIHEEPSTEMKSIVDSIKAKVSGEEEIVKGIFYWVQDNIRYIAFEAGMGGFIPRPANQVCSKKFGDCKDMAHIIKAMMEYAGIPGHLCWIGTRSKGYTYSELPLPYCDNHMIAAYKKGEDFIFLDATSKQHPFGFPSSGIQGKEAMISLTETDFVTQMVPIVKYDQNFVKDTVYMSLSNQVIKMKGKGTMGGYIKSDLTDRVQYAGKQNEKETWKQIIKRGNNKCELDKYDVKNIGDREKFMEINYELSLPDYAKSIGNEIYINFNFNRHITDMKPDTLNRQVPVDYDYELSDIGYFVFQVPEGYKVKEMPADFVLQNPYFDVNYTYSLKNGQIIVDKYFALKSIHVPVEEIKQLVAEMDKVAVAYQKVVVLAKN